MSKSLLKVLDLSLFPAALMVVGKFIGLIVVTRIFDIPFTLAQLSQGLISARPEVPAEFVTTASTYSDLIMYVILAIGVVVVVVQATQFHDKHISPKLLLKLSNHNLMSLIKGSYEIYHSAAVWTLFIWVATVIVWINVLAGKTALWMGVVAITSSIIFCIALLQDVYSEIMHSKEDFGGKSALG